MAGFRRGSNRKASSSSGPPSSAEFMLDDDPMASDDADDADWNMMEGDEDDEEDDDDVLSVASSVPTTEVSATDIRSTASGRAHRIEAQRIFSARLMVIAVFLLVTIAVSVSVYGFANQSQNQSFNHDVSTIDDRWLRIGFPVVDARTHIFSVDRRLR